MQGDANVPLRKDASGSPASNGVMRLPGAYAIDIARIRPDPAQPRRTFDDEGLRQLAESVRQRGIRQPIRVRRAEGTDDYLIVSGERRYRAAKAAGLAQLPCVLEQGSGDTTSSILIDQVVENWQRVDLNPFELSDALMLLKESHGLTQEEIASKTGKPKSEISRLLSIQRIDADVQQEVREHFAISRRHAVTLAQLPAKEQRHLLERIKEEHLTAIETEQAGRRVREQLQSGARRRRGVTVKRYTAGLATVEFRFRKAVVTNEELLDTLDQVRTEIEAGTRSSAGGA